MSEDHSQPSAAPPPSGDSLRVVLGSSFGSNADAQARAALQEIGRAVVRTASARTERRVRHEASPSSIAQLCGSYVEE